MTAPAHAWRRACAACAVSISILAAAAVDVAAEPLSVSYTTEDGFRVSADYYRPDAPSARAVLLLPDPTEGRGAWVAIADSLRSFGLHVLVPDLRGTGESAMQRGIRRDRARFTPREVAAAGLDGEAGLRYLRDLPATSIRSVALVGSASAATDALPVGRGPMDRIARLLLSPEPPEGTRAGDDWNGALLVISSSVDMIGVEATAAILERKPDSECWLVEGVGRGVGLIGARSDLIPLIVRWIDRSLGSS